MTEVQSSGEGLGPGLAVGSRNLCGNQLNQKRIL